MTMSLSPFAELPGASLPIRPPFPFESVSTRLFPLRASLDTLQRFVDGYLNIIPPELGRFRVPMPYVQLMILDYGKMAIEVGNYGWLAQREILFNIPLEWYVVKDGKWVFKDWASFSPFIYVDDDMSMTVGRMVYGWPKTTAQIVPAASDWVRNPGAPVKEAIVQTSVFSSLYSDQRLEMQPLIEVERDAVPGMLQLPFDPRASWTPWGAWSTMMQTVAGLGRDTVGWMAGAGVLPMSPATSADNYLAMARKMATMGFPFRPHLASNTLCLKQFRSSENPNEYCYQAVTNGVMRFTRLNSAGVLGEARMMAGDATGGYRIHLHQWPSLPIVETLGLEVERQWRGSACDIATLRPVFPLWYNVNMVYEPGTNVAWRTRDARWHDSDGRPYPDAAREGERTARLFNTSLGASNRTIAGAFKFEETTVRVLPLLAHREKLVAFLDATFNAALANGNAGDGERFTLWGGFGSSLAHVYLTVSSIGRVSSKSDNIGDWAGFELSFLVPVRRERRVGDAWELVGVGVVPAFTFVDNPTAAAANAEVLGIPTSNAVFIVPDTNWMSSDGPAREAVQPLLGLEAEVLPVVGRGERSERRAILSIEAGRVAEMTDVLEWRVIADEWAQVLTSELARKKALKAMPELDVARSLALEVLGNKVPLSLYTLKQFRDVADPTKACYQSLVRVRRTMSEIHDVREIERPLTVRITDYPTLPIVEMLGLVSHQVEGAGGLTYALQPQRPFWVTGTVDEALGDRVRYCAGTGGWDVDPALPTYLSERARDTGVALAAMDRLDGGDARRMAKAGAEWPVDADAPAARRQAITRAEAVHVLSIVDPQPVIESLLSREWGNWNEDARWVSARRALLTALRARLAGVSPQFVAEEQDRFFSERIHQAGRRPGEAPIKDAHDMRMRLLEFAGHKYVMEQAWQTLADRARTEAAKAGGTTGTATGLLEARRAFVRAVEVIEETDVLGRPEAPDLEAGASTVDNHERLHELVDQELKALARAMALGASLGGTPPSVEAITGPTEESPAVSRDALKQLLAVEEVTFANSIGTLDAAARRRLASNFIADASAHHEPLREMVRLARERGELQRSALINRLARTAQKPDYVVPRVSVGTEADRLFPMAQSWDEWWYAGANPDVSSRDGGSDSGPQQSMVESSVDATPNA
ncbi:MAG: hypothetical protein IPK85_20830 [Gemmatimonadetes bacterium]|nr:hypothetical protein [Gemmatimonadota bacterium]